MLESELFAKCGLLFYFLAWSYISDIMVHPTLVSIFVKPQPTLLKYRYNLTNTYLTNDNDMTLLLKMFTSRGSIVFFFW